MISKYDKQPYVEVNGYDNSHVWNGYEEIVAELKVKLENISSDKKVIAIDFYPGVRVEEVKSGIIIK